MHGRVGRAGGVRPGGAAARRRSPAAAHRRDRDAQGGRVAGGDRPGAAPPRAEDHRDIRQGRPRGAAAAGASVAGREVRHEPAAGRRWRLSADPPPARVRDAPGRPAVGRVRRVPRAGRRGADHHRAGAAWARLPAARTRTAGASGSRSRAGSPGIWRRSTPPARFRPRTCCPGTDRGSRPTSTPTRRSRR